jgi:hypothetical protein
MRRRGEPGCAGHFSEPVLAAAALVTRSMVGAALHRLHRAWWSPAVGGRGEKRPTPVYNKPSAAAAIYNIVPAGQPSAVDHLQDERAVD